MTFLVITQSTANRSKALSRINPPRHKDGGQAYVRRITFSVICLCMLIILGGCRARQLIRPTPQMNVEPQFWVRVLLLDDVTECVLKTGSPFSIINTQTETTQGRFGQTDEPIKATISDGIISIAGRQFKGKEVTIAPDTPHIFNLNGSDYRGKLKLIVNSSPSTMLGTGGDCFDAINLVPLEPYVAGVVGAEMPDYWEPAALQAQAIAARTYCLYHKKRFGSTRDWDVTKTQANQVYAGVSAESAQVWDAINRTYGKVLVCKHSNGIVDIFPAYYSSTCGGHTESSENVFGDSFEALAGVPCPYCQDVARLNLFFWPMVQFDKSSVTDKLLQKYPTLTSLGKITNITAVKQSEYGKFSRLTKVKLVGSTGKSDFLRAEDLRLTIDPTGNKFKSTICQITDMNDKWAFSLGRGWGHGVGMCQCGAEGMARQRFTAQQILSYYYPGSKIVSVY